MKGEVIAIDGKTLRHSYDTSQDKAAIHMVRQRCRRVSLRRRLRTRRVSAWATQNRLVLGQVKVDDKSNEITAIPELLKVLSLQGCIVTIDAMGCQREIVKQIKEGGGDYVITLKKNQGGLYERVEALFKEALIKRYEGFTFSSTRVSEPGHGREETRYCMMLSDIQNQIDPEGKWQDLLSIGRQDAMRVVKGLPTIRPVRNIISVSKTW